MIHNKNNLYFECFNYWRVYTERERERESESVHVVNFKFIHPIKI